jgi:hypothetical protein
MAHAKGLHEARVLPIGNLMQPKDQRIKLTAKLARLEHQRGLLERQFTVWMEKQKVTKNRLNLLDKEMADIERLIRESRVADRGRRRKRVAATKSDRQQKYDGLTARQRDFSVEY